MPDSDTVKTASDAPDGPARPTPTPVETPAAQAGPPIGRPLPDPDEAGPGPDVEAAAAYRENDA